jgi:hypothetical protein
VRYFALRTTFQEDFDGPLSGMLEALSEIQRRGETMLGTVIYSTV